MQDEKTALALWLASVLILAAGCNGSLTVQARQLLQESYSFYESGDDAAAMRNLNLFLRDNAKSSRADEAFYLRGLTKRRTKGLAGAKSDFDAAVRQTENKILRAKAIVALGGLAYEADDMALAETMYRQALADIEQGEKPSDHAHYRLGCTLQRQGRWDEADVHFDRVVYLFEGVKLAALAKRRAHCRAWTIQAGAFQAKARADLAANRLQEKNLSAVCRSILYDARPLFVVQVGRFDTYEQAIAGLAQTQRHEPDAFVVATR